MIVWCGNDLLEQWLARCEEDLGLDRNEVGIVQGAREDVFPVTIAMQQTLAARSEWVEEHKRDFGIVIADEALGDVLPCRVRFSCGGPVVEQICTSVLALNVAWPYGSASSSSFTTCSVRWLHRVG